jgi:hypothetical protein
MIEGLSALGANPSLRAIGLSVAAFECSFGIVGTVYSLYALRDLGFKPGLLRLVYAVGGVSSLLAALLAGRVTRRFGIVARLLLLAQQVVGDGGATIYEINETSIRQTIAPAPLLGRINAGVRVAALGATLLGTVAGALLAQTAGYLTGRTSARVWHAGRVTFERDLALPGRREIAGVRPSGDVNAGRADFSLRRAGPVVRRGANEHPTGK